MNISYDRDSLTSEFYEDPRVSEANSISDLSDHIEHGDGKQTEPLFKGKWNLIMNLMLVWIYFFVNILFKLVKNRKTKINNEELWSIFQ